MAHIAAEQLLRNVLEEVADEQVYVDPDIKISPITTQGANYTSILFEATISSKEKDDLDLFAKVAAVGEKMREQSPIKYFDMECVFYTELMKEYLELEEKHGVPEEHRFRAPKIFAVSSKLYEEVFVMENLASKGYIQYDRHKSVEWEYAASAFTELAKMHALSMALKHEKPEVYKSIAEKIKFVLPANNGLKLTLENTMQKSMGVIREDIKGKVMVFLNQFMKGGMEAFLKFLMPNDTSVIRHGDFRPSNLMHKVKEDGSLDLAVVDFQTLQPSTPVIDLLYFIFLGSDREFRAKYYDQLIDHYYKELSAALSRLGLDPEETYSRQQFDNDMKENLNYGVIVGMTTLVLVTADTEDAPEVDGENFFLESVQTIKRSSVFADRLNGIFDDFIEWGII